MTAVLNLLVENWPLMVGDVLLSSRPKPGRRIVLPTTSDVSADPSADYVPSDLCQKVALIGDHIVLGWSGKQTTAADVVGEMLLRSQTEHFDRRAVDAFMDRQPSSLWKEIGLLWTSNDSNELAGCGRSHLNAASTAFGTVGLLGSGAELLAEFVQEQPVPKFTSDMGPPDRAVGYGLFLTSTLMQYEIATSFNLAECFGAGYEVATMSGGKFVKVDDIIHVFWTARYYDKNHLGIDKCPTRVIRYSYQNDLMVIRALEGIGDTSENATLKENIYLVPPVYRRVTKYEQDNLLIPDLNAKWLVNYVLVTFKKGEPAQLLCIVDYRKVPDSMVQFHIKDGKVIVAVEERHLERIGRAIVEHPEAKSS
jgi:hypothetical protein